MNAAGTDPESQLPRVLVHLPHRRTLALIDTEATANFIREDLVPTSDPVRDVDRRQEIKLVSAAASTKSEGTLRVALRLEGSAYGVDCLIVPDLREEIILGQEWLKGNDVVDLARQCIHLDTSHRQIVHWHRSSSW